MRTLTFAIDFDGTLAADPDLFREFLSLLRANGHHAVLVTQRTPEFSRDVQTLIRGWNLPVVYAGGRTKREAARRDGWNPDIWIDDNPASVDQARLYVGG